MITGLDLVEWQLQVAEGLPLPLAQEDLSIHGHALEARIYAEDPDKGFLPSTGTLVHLASPAESVHVRVDTGVEQGDEITAYYDPMIAKLIVWDASREQARGRLLQALAQYRIVGVANNVEFLARVVACPAFARADLDTGLIERERAYLFPEQDEAPVDAYRVAALATLLREEERARREAERDVDPHSPWHLRDGFRLNSNAERKLIFRHGEAEKTIVVGYAAGGYRLEVDGTATLARGELGTNAALRVDLNGVRLDATVVVAGEKRHVFLQGRSYQFARVDPLHYGGEGAGPEGGLVAPMPGRIVALLVAAGANVVKGTPLLVLEAMKMEHTITAPAAGLVKGLRFGVGDQVTEGVDLVDFEPAEAQPPQGGEAHGVSS
jgi:3-methylcrotonyl-CoA carboxylase alpha subunit